MSRSGGTSRHRSAAAGRRQRRQSESGGVPAPTAPGNTCELEGRRPNDTGFEPWVAEIDELVGRAAHAVLRPDIATEDGASVQALFADLATVVAGAATASLAPLSALVEQANAAAASDMPSRFAAIEATWNGWKAARIAQGPVHMEPLDIASLTVMAGAVTAAPDTGDELATLLADPELAGMFAAEALDHLGSIEALVLQAEQQPDDSRLLNDIFRPFHTIKGNAGALGIAGVQQLAHSMENLLDRVRAGEHRLGAPEIDAILRSVDLLTAMIRGLAPRASGVATPDVREECLTLMAQVSALVDRPRTSASEERSTPRAPRATTTDGRMPPGGRDEAPAAVKVDTRKLDTLVDTVGELVIVQSIIQEDPALQGLVNERLGRNLGQLKRITSDLQRIAMSMRMTPIRPTFRKMARLVRDLGQRSGKDVDLVLSGEDTELDRKVVEDITDPLMHMVRNSVDHGIESPDRRRAAGKPARARVSLDACHEGGAIVIALADDGAGLDTERIRRKAVAMGLIADDAPMSPADIHELIFRPGFSTAERVTEISGRGVGMDVVRRNIEMLRGRIEMQTTPGAGTTFCIRLPLTLAILEGLLLRAGTERFVLPTFCVRESLRPSREQVHAFRGERRVIQVRDSLLPMIHLSELFDGPGPRPDPWAGTVVVVEDNGRRMAVVVDELLGKQEVVIKSLGDAFSHVRGVAGGAILGDGRVGLILDAGGLVGLLDRPLGRAA